MQVADIFDQFSDDCIEALKEQPDYAYWHLSMREKAVQVVALMQEMRTIAGRYQPF